MLLQPPTAPHDPPRAVVLSGATSDAALGAKSSHSASPSLHPPAAPDSGAYASPALRALVAAMAAEGRDAPRALAGYRAQVESELAVVLRTAAARDGVGAAAPATAGERAEGAPAAGAAEGGRERVVQVEQVESTVDWTAAAGAPGRVEQHVIGYRARGVTAGVSALSVLRRPWVVPVLYGNRLQLLLGRGSATSGNAGGGALLAVHPFADDRDRVYQFSGGDTLVTMRQAGRAIPIVRVLVEPRGRPPVRTLLFRGELDVDAARHQIVRMRGQFVTVGRERSLVRRVFGAAWQTVAFAELENSEFDGRFWLPTRQRLEGQARSPLAGEFRPTFRVVSRFRRQTVRLGPGGGAALAAATPTAAPNAVSNVAPNGSPNPAADSAGAAPSGGQPARLTFAPRDSVGAFRGWSEEIGAATGAARTSDFDDVAPDSWRPQGPPRVDFRAERISDVFRFNRAEGVFLGGAATYRFRDRAPGVAVGGSAGWAFTEETARGNLWLRAPRAGWALGVRGERLLATTNDFRPTLDVEQSLSALLVTADDYDYVDRRALTLSASRALPLPGAPLLRLEAGPGYDAAERRRVRYGVIHPDSTFRLNRAVTPGGYVRTAVGLDLHPNVSGEFLEPGIGAGLWYERGDGALRWQRLEARLTARHTRGAFTYAGRADAIAVASPGPVPQQLVEFGENEGLPGYAYKEFGGDRAVLARAAVIYEFPFLRAPIHVGRPAAQLGRGFGLRVPDLYLPGLSPSLAFGVNAGWADARSGSARAGLALFGTRTDRATGQLVAATRPTDGVRSTVNATLRLFGGTLGLGVARPIDQHGPTRGWQFVFGVGQPF